ncbi:MAG: type I methionyl aminopeptidase [Patescibacteria group bacterium]
MVRLKKERDLRLLRVSGRILAEMIEELSEMVREGTPLSALDARARTFIASRGATPTFLGYQPAGSDVAYPAAICTSVNDIIVHGLPTAYRLRSGDIVKIDAGVTYQGYITDAALTVAVLPVAPRVRRLITATQEALDRAIAECRPGNHLGDVGHAVSSTVRRSKFSVLRGLTGHGVGFSLHEDPTVYNFGKRREGMELVPGLVLAIEPMVGIGSPDIVQYPDNSYGTSDRSFSAHFEHTVVITGEGNEVLTKLA